MRGHDPSPAVKLPRAALAFRTVRAAIAAEQLLAIAYVWWCALGGRRGRLLRIATASLIGEGVLVAANRRDCPLGGLQDRLGDPVPLFELVLSPRAAKRAVPTLGAIAAAGLVLLVARSRAMAPACRSGSNRGDEVRTVNRTEGGVMTLFESKPHSEPQIGTRVWIERHQVASFFALAYAITWVAWLPAIAGLGVILARCS